jgi:hypothetical protein
MKTWKEHLKLLVWMASPSSKFSNAENREAIRAALEGHDAMARALLAVEWSGTIDGGFRCPECGRSQRYGHLDDCALGLALRAAGVLEGP